jgi:hypothetical protein
MQESVETTRHRAIGTDMNDQAEILTMERALDAMRADDLRKLASLTGERVPSRKEDMATVIVKHLAGERLRTVWEGLDELQRAAVAEAVHSPSSQLKADLFRAKYGKDPDWGSARPFNYGGKPSALCFFIYNGIVPADLKTRLLKFVPAPRPAAVATLDQLPLVYERPWERWNEKQRMREKGTEAVPLAVHETERAALRELLSVLRLVDAGKVAVSGATRRASTSTIDAITAILDRGDYYLPVPPKSKWYDENAGPIRAFAWPLLIQAAGLAQLAGTRLQLTRAGRNALSEPAAGTIRTLWTKWMGTTILDELARIDCVKGQTGKGKRGLTAVAVRREAIAGSLARCPSGRWVATEEFLRYMRATGKHFSLGYDGNDRILTGRYLFTVLLEYAATLGLIDVALIPPAGARRDFRQMWGADDLPFFSRYDGLMYFRLTPLGAWCLGVDSDYQPAPVEVKPVLRVQSNLEIAATGSDLEQGDRLALNAYATPVSDFVWRLDAGKLLAAIEAGRPMEEIRAFLAARSGAEIPNTVMRLLDDVAERTTKVHDRGLARLIECDDPPLAALIANDRRTRKYCMRAGEQHLVVAASSEAAFRRALRDAGFLLATEDKHPSRKGQAQREPAGEQEGED